MNLGAWGEKIAAEFLKSQGYRILDRNWHAVEGEIDIVAEHQGCLVFVEVKTRGGSAFGSPEEAVQSRKKRRLRRTAWRYLESTDALGMDWRIDVVAIERARDGSIARFDHYINAVEAPGDLGSL